MNKTKRKIFETSMKLFAQKGYEATSIEEITATVGVAKGTLYYHFSSKEEIFYFLVEEGMKLLKNSIEIKTSKLDNAIDKLKAIIEEKEKSQLKIELLYQERLAIELVKHQQTFLLEQKSKDETIEKLESENQMLKEENSSIESMKKEIEEYKKKEEEYNSKSFFYRLTHKF